MQRGAVEDSGVHKEWVWMNNGDANSAANDDAALKVGSLFFSLPFPTV